MANTAPAKETEERMDGMAGEKDAERIEGNIGRMTFFSAGQIAILI